MWWTRPILFSSTLRRICTSWWRNGRKKDKSLRSMRSDTLLNSSHRHYSTSISRDSFIEIWSLKTYLFLMISPSKSSTLDWAGKSEASRHILNTYPPDGIEHQNYSLSSLPTQQPSISLQSVALWQKCILESLSSWGLHKWTKSAKLFRSWDLQGWVGLKD